MKERLSSPPGRQRHLTPLRYPGGKGKLASYLKAIIQQNSLLDGTYVEPYAGGAAIAIELLLHEYVSQIYINDLSKPIYSFWKSILNNTDDFCRLIRDTPLTVRSWDRHKKVFANPTGHSQLELGFATFFLNRTNRSGILNGGPIGGRDQNGPWKIDARFNRTGLISRIEAIAKMKRRINVTRKDAVKFLSDGIKQWPEKTLIYLDPPYFVKGRDLYYDFYHADDHLSVRDLVRKELKERLWVVSYDNVKEIRAMYKGFSRRFYKIGYSAREVQEGAEVMFFSHAMPSIPARSLLR